MKTFITTAVLFGFCFYVTSYSREHLVPVEIAALLIIGLLSTLLTSIWIKGPFLYRQIKAAKIAFPFTAIFYLIGYFYTILRVVICIILF